MKKGDDCQSDVRINSFRLQIKVRNVVIILYKILRLQRQQNKRGPGGQTQIYGQ